MIGHLWKFDLRRCRVSLIAWWCFCAGLAVLGWLLFNGMPEPYLAVASWLQFAVLAFLAVVVGLVVQPGNPGRTRSFFRARPVSAAGLAWARALLLGLGVLLPLYLGALPIVLAVAPDGLGLLAFSLHFLPSYAAAILLLAALASRTRTMAGYLVAAVVVGIVLMFVSEAAKDIARRGGVFVNAGNPAAAQLLWQTIVLLGAGGIFFWSFLRIYGPRKAVLAMSACGAMALLAAAAMRAPNFRHDPRHYGWTVPESVVETKELQWKVERLGKNYDTIIIKPHGMSGWTQWWPPYVDSHSEQFWTFSGSLSVERLDSEIAFSARLIDAQWTAPDGAVLALTPPAGHSELDPAHPLPPPRAFKAGVERLLGVRIADPFPIRAISDRAAAVTILFGAWTSDYARYRTEPGRLEARVRVDFYRHEVVATLPLAEAATISTAEGSVHYSGSQPTDDGLTLSLTTLRPEADFRSPIGTTWSSYAAWYVFEPGGGGAAENGGGRGRAPVFPWTIVDRERMRFEPSGLPRENPPDFQHPERLKLARIRAVYLGSTEVTLTLDDLPLVNPKSLEPR